MNNEKKVLIYLVNANFKVVDLLKKYYGIESNGEGTMHCPFHDDSRKSAKLYADNAIFCFTESKMYRPYDILRHQGFSDTQIKAMVPPGVFSPERKEEVLVDTDKMKRFFMKTKDLRAVVLKFYGVEDGKGN